MAAYQIKLCLTSSVQFVRYQHRLCNAVWKRYKVAANFGISLEHQPTFWISKCTLFSDPVSNDQIINVFPVPSSPT